LQIDTDLLLIITSTETDAVARLMSISSDFLSYAAVIISRITGLVDPSVPLSVYLSAPYRLLARKQKGE